LPGELLLDLLTGHLDLAEMLPVAMSPEMEKGSALDLVAEREQAVLSDL
jgi:hypothetical protein